MSHDDKHVLKHENGGEDAITPANIGANGVAEKTAGGDVELHAGQHGSVGADTITPASIGAEPEDITIMKEGENVSLLNNDADYRTGAQVTTAILLQALRLFDNAATPIQKTNVRTVYGLNESVAANSTTVIAVNGVTTVLVAMIVSRNSGIQYLSIASYSTNTFTVDNGDFGLAKNFDWIAICEE